MFSALILRPLRHDPGRTLLSVLAIALGVGVVIAIRVANRSAIASFQQSTQTLAGGADLLVTGPEPLPASLLPRLFPLDAQAEILPYLDRRAYDPHSQDTLEILGLDLLIDWRGAPRGFAARPAYARQSWGPRGPSPAGAAPLPLPGAGRPAEFRGLIAPTLPTVQTARPPRGANTSGTRAGGAQGPAPTMLPQLLLPATYAQLHQLRAGGTITLIIGGAPQRFHIGAILPTQAAGAGDIALLDLPAAVAAFEPGTEAGAAARFDGLRVALAPGAHRQAVLDGLRRLIPAADTVAPPRFQDQQAAAMLAAFRANLEALAYVSLLIGIFLIYNTVSISVVRRRTAIATVRALGATRAQVEALFLGEGLVLALAGGVLGWGLGWLLAEGALAAVQATIDSLYAPTHPAVLRLGAGDLAWALALAAGAGVLAAWVPARQAAGVAPAQALRPGGAEALAHARVLPAAIGAALLAAATYLLARLPEVAGLPLFGFASALAAALAGACLALPLAAWSLPRLRGFFLKHGHTALGMAAGGLAGALRRSAILTAALGIAIGVMLGVAIMVGSFRQTVQIWIGQQLQADVFVRSPDWDRDRPNALRPELIAAVLSTPGVATVEASHTQAWTFRGQPIFINTRWPLRGAPPSAPALRFLSGGAIVGADPSAPAARVPRGDVIVSEPFARRFHLWTGASFVLTTPSGPVQLTIAGVFYDYASDRGQLALAPSLYAHAFGPPAATELGLYAARGVSTAALRRNLYLNPELAGLTINDNRSLRAEAMQVFDQTFRITYALEAITLLVAILGVGNTLLAVVLERAPEFALLRFLGATRGQIRTILLAESALIATAALALGAGIGAALALILVRVINVQSFGWTIQFHPPYAFLVPAAAAVWAATFAAGWFPARAAQRQSPAAALEVE